MEVIHPEGVFRALFGVFTGQRHHIHGRGGYHVHVILAGHRHLGAHALAHQHGGAINDHAAAIIAVIKDIHVVLWQGCCGGDLYKRHRTRQPLYHHREQPGAISYSHNHLRSRLPPPLRIHGPGTRDAYRRPLFHAGSGS